ncbi:SAM-dependent methyltransferase OS=Afipia felis OX=1035 GN=BN961_04087 PE=4 SV=1 [Afipia felis]
MTSHRLQYPATERNRDAILNVLRGTLPPSGLVLEIASGSGEHAMHFAAALPGLTFQPSDPEDAARRSIEAWTAETGLSNIRPPLDLDVLQEPWPVAQADAILCINMIHISPWAATAALMRNAERLLARGAPLYLYGPYRQRNVVTAESNEAFDADLKSRNPQWGLRHLDDVAALAREAEFSGPEVTPMPANNLSVVFRRS